MKKQMKFKVKAVANCASFDITVNATITSDKLMRDELSEVKRKFQQQLADGVSKLPFSHTYPFEVEMQ